MTNKPLSWENPANIYKILKDPMVFISIYFFPLKQVNEVILWFSVDCGLRLTSTMMDLEDGDEVGHIKFEIIEKSVKSEIIRTDIELSPCVIVYSIYRYSLFLDGKNIDAGIRFVTNIGDILILPAASPYGLYVSGVPGLDKTGVPEYYLDEYTQVLQWSFRGNNP